MRADHRDADGIGIASGALTLNGGSIRSAAGTAAILDLGSRANGNNPSHRVDGSQGAMPEVSGVEISSRPQDGTTYGAGELTMASVEFTVPVRVSGRPALVLAVGSHERQASLYRSAPSKLTFLCEVQAEDMDSDGIGVPAGAQTLNGGSILSIAGAAAKLALGDHAISGDGSRKVDGSLATTPGVTGVTILSRPAGNGIHGIAQVIYVQVDFSVSVDVEGSPQLSLMVGQRKRQAALKHHSRNKLWFGYGTQPEDRDTNGVRASPPTR